MGSKKRRAARRSLATSQKQRFPIGDLARKTANLRQEFLSKSKEHSTLRKRVVRIKRKVLNIGKFNAKHKPNSYKLNEVFHYTVVMVLLFNFKMLYKIIFL